MTEPWLERWEEGRTGWHEANGNANLKRHWRVTGRKVLVPLCGKTPDLRWLADRGNQVFGVELSGLAIEAFFAEQGLSYTVQEDDLRVYQASELEITIFCGDYFELNSIQCDAHYDRGALVALSADVRPAYAAHTNSLLTRDAEQLVIALEYDEQIALGPPFSVTADELLDYWPGLACCDEHDDIANAPPKFIDAGLSKLIERVWRTP